MDHLILNNGSDSAALAEVALKALREARRSKTSNSGSIFVSDGQTDEDGIALGTGTIINGVNGGIQPWVGDTTVPGKPTGITAESHNGAIWVSWDGTLDGGIPADFDHVQFTAVDGSKTVDMGQLKAAGKVTAAELTAGDTVIVTAVAFDDAHDENGNSKPNASPISDAVPVIVQSAVSADEVQSIQSDLSQAKSDIAAAKSSVTDLTKTVSSVDGKATTSGSAPTTGDASGRPEGAMWYVMDASGNLTGTYVLKSGSWVKYAWASSSIADAAITDAKIANLDAGKITSGYVNAARIQAGTIDAGKLAAGSVTSDKIVADAVTSDKLVANAVTADKLAANSVTAVQLASKSVTADKADIGSLTAAIVSSGLFKTTDGHYGFDSDNGFWAGDISGLHVALTETSSGVSELAIMHGTDVISALRFIDTISTDGYVHTGIYTGDNGQFLEFATLVDSVNHHPDPLEYDVRLVAAQGTGRMLIEAQKAVNLSGVWFARSVDDLPSSPNVVGGAGTMAFVGGVDYVFDGAGLWVQQTQTNWIVCNTGIIGYYVPSASATVQALSVRKQHGMVELMGRVTAVGAVLQNSDMGEMIPSGYRPTVTTMIQSDQTGFGHFGPPFLVRPDGHIIWGPSMNNGTDVIFHGMWIGA